MPITKQEQIDQWSKFYGRQITEEEHREIYDNLYGFFKTLHGWAKKGGRQIGNRFY